MTGSDFEEARAFNLTDILEYRTNEIIVKDIKVHVNCRIQVLVFDYGKVLSFESSPDFRFIHILEGKTEIVINENSNFMKKGDSIVIPPLCSSSIEANHKFMILCITSGNS